MKAILIILALFVVGDVATTQAQYTTIPTETVIQTNCPDKIFPLLHEFIVEGRKRGVFVDWFISKNLHKIDVLSPEEMLVIDNMTNGDGLLVGKIIHKKVYTGINNFYAYRTEIYLNEKIFDHPYTLKAVTWHELGHFFGLPHNSFDDMMEDRYLIMNSHIPSVGMILAPPTEEDWKRYNDVLWEKIDKSDRDYWMKAKRNDGF